MPRTHSNLPPLKRFFCLSRTGEKRNAPKGLRGAAICGKSLPMQKSYLEQELSFFSDRIEVAETGTPVMMSWERPIMRRMAELAAMRRGAVLEVGFGMGISSTEVQVLGPRQHTIIEAHPQIIARARAWAAGRAGVELLAGRWQDHVDRLGAFDGVSFDVFAGEDQRLAFFAHLGRLLRPAGVATLWLGEETELPAPLAALLAEQGFAYHLTKVSAIPDKRCTYAARNEFMVPVIWRPAAGAPTVG